MLTDGTYAHLTSQLTNGIRSGTCEVQRDICILKPPLILSQGRVGTVWSVTANTKFRASHNVVGVTIELPILALP